MVRPQFNRNLRAMREDREKDTARLDYLLALAANTDFEVNGQIVTDLDRAKIDELMKAQESRKGE